MVTLRQKQKHLTKKWGKNTQLVTLLTCPLFLLSLFSKRPNNYLTKKTKGSHCWVLTSLVLVISVVTETKFRENQAVGNPVSSSEILQYPIPPMHHCLKTLYRMLILQHSSYNNIQINKSKKGKRESNSTYSIWLCSQLKGRLLSTRIIYFWHSTRTPLICNILAVVLKAAATSN